MARQPRGSKQRYPQVPQDPCEGMAIRKLVRPRNPTQVRLLESLDTTPLTICLGPAGTGKTFLAIHAALQQLLDERVEKIVITRPVVEAGENLGFLPGTLEEKLAPYLIPLMDAVKDLVGPTMAKRLMESGKVEIAPLAYMRGRTFNNAFVIADEMQNSSVEQVKLLVTRIGMNSSFSLNGDPAQSDLPDTPVTGIEWIARKLEMVPDGRINVIRFRREDVVRSELVRLILKHIGE